MLMVVFYLQTTLSAAEKNNDQLNSDYTKAMLSKGQLESLCRELQKQNKVTKVSFLCRYCNTCTLAGVMEVASCSVYEGSIF